VSAIVRSVGPVDAVIAVPARSPADRWARRLLRLPENGPRTSIIDAQQAFSRSIAISATRCLLTYVVLPFVVPLVDLSGVIGPVVGLLLGAVSMVAIVLATRRLFSADHRWRWAYAGLGGAVFVLLIVQAVIDISALVG
jgi:hypothetical protein